MIPEALSYIQFIFACFHRAREQHWEALPPHGKHNSELEALLRCSASAIASDTSTLPTNSGETRRAAVAQQCRQHGPFSHGRFPKSETSYDLNLYTTWVECTLQCSQHIATSARASHSAPTLVGNLLGPCIPRLNEGKLQTKPNKYDRSSPCISYHPVVQGI